MRATTCAHGHEIRSFADRDADRWCKQCRKSKNVSYRTRQSAALKLARTLEARGIQVTRSQPPVDLQQLADALAGRLPEAIDDEPES
jgi:hypothetical protein